jgi:hypothetical protein
MAIVWAPKTPAPSPACGPTPIDPVPMASGAADYTLEMGVAISRRGGELLYPHSKMAIACLTGVLL